MAVPEWDPLKELAGVQSRMNKLFETALARTDFSAEGGIGAWTPVADVQESSEALTFFLELPGVRLEDIDLHLEGDELLVQGERRMEREEAGEQYHRVERSYGKFSRRFPVPSTVDRSSVAATFRDGVLRISLPKKENVLKGPIRVAIR